MSSDQNASCKIVSILEILATVLLAGVVASVLECTLARPRYSSTLHGYYGASTWSLPKIATEKTLTLICKQPLIPLMDLGCFDF